MSPLTPTEASFSYQPEGIWFCHFLNGFFVEGYPYKWFPWVCTRWICETFHLECCIRFLLLRKGKASSVSRLYVSPRPRWKPDPPHVISSLAIHRNVLRKSLLLMTVCFPSHDGDQRTAHGFCPVSGRVGWGLRSSLAEKSHAELRMRHQF